MYPEYDKINQFFETASLVLETPQRMEDIFTIMMARNAKAIAVEYYNAKGKLKNYKYKKVKVNAYSCANALSHLLSTTAKHQIVALKIANGHHWGELFWAILMAGYKPLLIDAKLSKEGTTNVLAQSQAVAVITDDVYVYDVKKISSDDLLDVKSHDSFTPTWEDEVIFCSSGTTGDIKLMIYNGKAICHQLCCSLDMPKETKNIMYPKKYGDIKILAMIPFHHIFGFVAVFLWYSFYGKTIVFPSAIIPSEIQKICQNAGVTHVYSVPLFWDSLALSTKRKIDLFDADKKDIVSHYMDFQLGKISKEEAGKASWEVTRKTIQKLILGSKIRYCISGGGFLSQETVTTINSLGYPLCNGYGMTEIGVTSVELSENVSDRLKCSIGKPLHEVEYKLSNEGELLVKSSAIHVREIIGGKEQTPCFDQDGYFATGDIAEVQEDGRYYLKGRIKDIIVNANGENIFPDELEDAFKNIPCLKHLCLFGMPIKNSHEERVVLVLDLDNQISEEQLETVKKLVEEIRQHLPHQVKISDIYLAKNKLPLANGMKVKRFLVKKSLQDSPQDFLSINAQKAVKKYDDFSEETIKSILLPMRTIFSKVLILPTFKIDDNAHWVDDLGGDSMNYVELVKEVQDYFQVTLPEDKLGVMTCVNDFVYEVALLKKENDKSGHK